MGICGHKDDSKQKNPNKVVPKFLKKEIIDLKESQVIQNPNSNSFKDMEVWEGEIYKGEGIKRMRAYKCDLKIDDLQKVREDFWCKLVTYLILASKITNKNIWKVLKLAAVVDHVKSENLLKENNIKAVNGCLNHCIDSEQNNYYIPNYCINDPYFEKQIIFEQPVDLNQKINVNLYDLYENKTIAVKLPTNIKGIEIKKLYAEIGNLESKDYKIRLLFGGAEITDTQFLYQHKLQDGYTIQVIKNKVEG